MMKEDKPLVNKRENKPLISKQMMLLLMAIWVFATIYYQEYKKKKTLEAMTVVHSVASQPIEGTDPVRAVAYDTSNAVGKIYEGLYSYHFFKRPFKLTPNLAEAMPTVSADGLVYTFKIKQGVRFQNDDCFPNGEGRELKASDVVFSLKRLADPGNQSPYIGFIQGKIKGLDDWQQQADYAKPVEGLQVLDDYTLQVTLSAPWITFVHFLAMVPTFVVAEEAVKRYGAAFVNHPVGTGPFILKDGFNPQSKCLELIKNPNFREKLFPAEGAISSAQAYIGQRLPIVDRIVTHILQEEQPRLLKLKSGEIDIDKIDGLDFSSNIIKNGVLDPDWVKKGFVLHQEPGAHTEFFAFNHTNPLFQNTFLRQAMVMAFDREAYNDLFCSSNAQIATSLVPPSLMKGQNEHAYSYNLERAKLYLAQAGFPDGKDLPDITLDVRSDTTYKKKADFFAKCMAKIGIKIKVMTHIFGELHKLVRNQDTMMYLFDWWADYPEPSSFLTIICDKNLAGIAYDHIGFKQLLNKAMHTMDAQERDQYYAQLNEMIAEEVPIICAIHRPSQLLYHQRVKNVLYNECTPFILDEHIAIDKDKKQAIPVEQ